MITINNCKCIAEKPKAILVKSDEFLELGEEENKCWIPQEQVHDDSDVYKIGSKGKLVLKSGWFVNKKRWV